MVHALQLPALDPEPGCFDVSTPGKQFNTLIYSDMVPLTGAARDAVFMNPALPLAYICGRAPR